MLIITYKMFLHAEYSINNNMLKGLQEMKLRENSSLNSERLSKLD